MAVTGFWPVFKNLKATLDYADNPDKTTAPEYLDEDLYAALRYAENDDKTDRKMVVGGINCSAQNAYAEMIAVQRRFGLCGKVVGYHGIQSFREGEVTPEQAHEAGVEFARRLLGDKYEAVVCTHTDRDHLHCHIVFNSVSFMDGRKYRSDFKSYFHDLRGISNEVSRELGYSVIEPDGKGVSYSAWNAEKRGSGTIRDLIRRDIDAALAGSLTYDTFLETLRRQGYSVKRGPNVKHTAVRPPGGQRFVRVESLGLGYTEAELMQRLNEQRHEPEPTAPVFSAQKRYTIRRRPRRYPPVKRGSFRALYLYYLYLLSPRKKRPQKVPFETRAEIRRAKQYRQPCEQPR